MMNQTTNNFSKLAFSMKTQLGVVINILKGFMREFGMAKGFYLFAKIIFTMNKTKKEILMKGNNVPKDKILDLAATALTAYRVVNNILNDNEKTHQALRRTYIDPYSTYMCKALMSSTDAEFQEVTAFFDWGFGLFGPWIQRKQLRTNDSHYDFDITFCKFAETFQRMGCPEVTPVICAMDIGLYQNLKKIKMQRTNTIGMGADHCDFRFSKVSTKTNVKKEH